MLRWRTGPIWNELWHINGKVVWLTYDAEWWSREGSIKDLETMALEKYKDLNNGLLE